MDGLDPGTYYVQEISAPSGYNLDPTVHTVNVSLANTATLSLTNSSIKGYIAIKKTNADPTKGAIRSPALCSPSIAAAPPWIP